MTLYLTGGYAPGIEGNHFLIKADQALLTLFDPLGLEVAVAVLGDLDLHFAGFADNAKAHNNLGILCSIRGNHASAIRHFKEAIRADPELTEAKDNLGISIALTKDHPGSPH